MEFPNEAERSVDYDENGYAVHIRHLTAPFTGEAGASAKQVALAYLTAAFVSGPKPLLPMDEADLKYLRRTRDSEEPSSGARFRWSPAHEVKRRPNPKADLRTEATIVAVQQTMHGIDDLGRGIRILVQHRCDAGRDVLSITSLSSTATPPEKAPARSFRNYLKKLAAARPGELVELARELVGISRNAPPPRVRLAVRRSLQHGRVAHVPLPFPGPGGEVWTSMFGDPADVPDAPSPVTLHVELTLTTDQARLSSFRLAVDPLHGTLVAVEKRGATCPSPPSMVGGVSRAAPIAEAIAAVADAARAAEASAAAIGNEEAGARTASVTASPESRGLVFRVDPVSRQGPDGPGPSSSAALLDPHRTSEKLLNLTEMSGYRVLDGPRVTIAGSNPLYPPNPLGFDPPSEPHPFRFDYGSRTNDFAAVSAYRHVDGVFLMVHHFGFDLALVFTNLPIRVVHRAPIDPGYLADGQCVNAQVIPGLGREIAEMRFALASLTDSHRNPIGLAADVRWAWHEFCHALLIASTGEPEFPFAHSAGDALAAILLDPNSKFTEPAWEATWRGVTSPWVTTPLRRHDRTVADGWGWHGTMYRRDRYKRLGDPAGYVAEQILSSTLFRLYRCAGGDAKTAAGAPDLARRAPASHQTAYLIVRAIISLGIVVPADTASMFATALMEADIGTSVSPVDDLPGGRLHKVIRWAFEKQGLYQPAGSVDGEGAPEPVDVFVDDGRSGEYQWTDDWTAKPDAVWIRRNPDGQSTDQPPRPGTNNWVYVRVWNRGTARARAHVEIRARTGAQRSTWEDTSAWAVVAPRTPGAARRVIPPGQSRVFGPYRWSPSADDHALLIRATAPGDLSNIEPSTGLPCAPGPIDVKDLVPFDNNLGYREWTVA